MIQNSSCCNCFQNQQSQRKFNEAQNSIIDELRKYYFYIIENFLQITALINLQTFQYKYIIIVQPNKMIPIKYITPRIAIVLNQYTTYYYQINQYLSKIHAHYFHLFNLTTNQQLEQYFGNKVSNYKNRGYPFSLKQTFHLCLLIDKYLRAKTANTVVILCNNNNEYSSFIIICYMFLCGRFSNIQQSLLYYQKKNQIQLPKAYFTYIESLLKDQEVYPTVRYVQSIKIQPQLFIPVYEIYTQSRFQQFTLTYKHQIQKQLEEYYYNKDKQQYYDNKPVTFFLKKPAVILGDTIINISKYDSLRHQKIVSFSFNTIFLQGINQMILSKSDFYNCTIKDNLQVTIKFSDYCYCSNKTKYDQKCFNCNTLIKTLRKEYSEMRDILQQFQKNRSVQYATILLFGQPNFDDVNKI